METIVNRFAAACTGIGRQESSCRLKSNLTLDINVGRSWTGNGIDSLGVGCFEDGLLSTPDVGLLKLGTPELERLVLHQFMQQQQSESTAGDLLEQQQTPPQKRNSFLANTTSATSIFSGAETHGGAYDQQYELSVALPQQLALAEILPEVVNDGDCRRQMAPVVAVGSSSSTSASNDACVDRTSIDGSSRTWQDEFYVMPVPPVADRSNYTSSAAIQLSPSASSVCTSGTSSTPPPPQQQQRVRQGPVRESRIDRVLESAPSLSDDFVVDDVTYGSWYPQTSKRRRRSSFDDDDDDSMSFLSRRRTSGVYSPPISPINMAAQERIKLERKRARNRQAATRCRNRKLERIATLQDQADRLRAINSQLSCEVNRLRETVHQLRRDISRHSAAGCQPTMATSMSVAFPVLQQQQQPTYMMNSVVGTSGRCFESVY